MRISFVGDSFCADEKGWPGIVAKSLNAEIAQLGVPGHHIYSQFKKLLVDINSIDYIVICVTEPNRIYNDFDLGINSAWAAEDKYVGSKEIIKEGVELGKIHDAARKYYEYLHNWEYHKFMNVTNIEHISGLLHYLNKKVIWFPCFRNSLEYPDFLRKFYGKSHYNPVTGAFADTPLYDISRSENLEKSFFMGIDPRDNHFSNVNNKILANLILDIIKKDDFTGHPIKMLDHFKVSWGDGPHNA